MATWALTGGPSARGREALARVRMLKQVRPGLQKWCRGLAFVVSELPPEKALKVADKLWGCPTFSVPDAEQAREWARQALGVGP